MCAAAWPAAVNSHFHVLEWLADELGKEAFFPEVFLAACQSPRPKRNRLLHSLIHRQCELPSSYALYRVPDETRYYFLWLRKDGGRAPSATDTTQPKILSWV